MISQEDSERICEAKNCNDCLSWHKHCKAECCKIVFLNIDPELLKKNENRLLNLKVGKLSPSDTIYYQLRGVEYKNGGILRFPKKDIIVVGRNVMYVRACKRLDGNLCEGHPDRKPKMCRDLTINTSHKFTLTNNCLFRYKNRGTGNEEKKEGTD